LIFRWVKRSLNRQMASYISFKYIFFFKFSLLKKIFWLTHQNSVGT
jgi:hypothetical protein